MLNCYKQLVYCSRVKLQLSEVFDLMTRKLVTTIKNTNSAIAPKHDPVRKIPFEILGGYF
jgi:hypothetical protein